MSLEGNGSGIYTENKEDENRRPRASYSNFLPCSLGVLFLISAFTSFSFWLTTDRILLEESPGRRSVSSNDQTLKAVDIKYLLGENDAIKWYTKLADKISTNCGEESFCCVYRVDEEKASDKEYYQNHHNKDLSKKSWPKDNLGNNKSPNEKVQNELDKASDEQFTYLKYSNGYKSPQHVWLCRGYEQNRNEIITYHFRTEIAPYETDDVLIELGDGVKGLSFGRSFWAFPSKREGPHKNAYLLCDIGKGNRQNVMAQANQFLPSCNEVSK